MNSLEAMAARRSTRSFSGEKMSKAEAEELSAMLASLSGAPFGHAVRLALRESGENGKPVKLGTYGLISGASAFIVPAVFPGPGAMEDVGYIVEKAVLEATAKGWASCWIGGVFSRGKAAEVVGLRAGELVPAVIALGRPAERRSLADRLVTGAAKSRSRKPLDQILFSPNGATFAEPWLSAARALRDAPSASNKQPWRLVGVPARDEWVIFLDEDRVYNNSLGEAHLQNLDIGIGMRHFQESAIASGFPGRWAPLPAEHIDMPGEGFSLALDFGRSKGWVPIAFWR